MKTLPEYKEMLRWKKLALLEKVEATKKEFERTETEESTAAHRYEQVKTIFTDPAYKEVLALFVNEHPIVTDLKWERKYSTKSV